MQIFADFLWCKFLPIISNCLRSFFFIMDLFLKHFSAWSISFPFLPSYLFGFPINYSSIPSFFVLFMYCVRIIIDNYSFLKKCLSLFQTVPTPPVTFELEISRRHHKPLIFGSIIIEVASSPNKSVLIPWFLVHLKSSNSFWLLLIYNI